MDAKWSDTNNISQFHLNQMKRWHNEYVRILKGIDTTSAMTVHVEIADFTRFPTAKAFMAYVGLTPSENSSGEKISRSAITKQDNSTVRSTLLECEKM
ncbi:IS110 family transposase [Bacillus cereus]|nr:IS110 family transposase [Bacillus cereus]